MIKLKKLLEQSIHNDAQTLMMHGMPKKKSSDRNSLMVQGVTGKGLGKLNLDDEEIQEVHFTGETLDTVSSDVLSFVHSEHKKLGYGNPLDTVKLIQQVLDSGRLIAKIKNIK